MAAKLLHFSGSGRLGAFPHGDGKIYFRGAARAPVPRAAAPRQSACSGTALECRWRIDPAAGVFIACWVPPPATCKADPDGAPESLDIRRSLRLARHGLGYVIASFTERHGFPAPPCRRFQPPMVHAPVGTLGARAWTLAMRACLTLRADSS